MNFYTEGLSLEQIQVLLDLAPFVNQKRFFLVGGTALTIYLRHRQSLDLDWFTQNRFDHPINFSASLTKAGILFSVIQVAEGTLIGVIRGVRVSFLEFSYPFLAPLVPWDDFGIYLASLEDLAAMKLAAIAQRGSRKDFYDIYALGQSVFTLAQMLEFYQRKFSIGDIGHVLYGLVYFEDAEQEEEPVLLKQITWAQVKETIREWVKHV